MPRSNTPKRSQEEWEQIINEYASSNESLAGFCRRRGVSDGSFQYWRARLERQAGSPAAEPLAVDRYVLSQSPPSARYEIRLSNGRSITVTGGFNPTELAGLVSLLEA